MTTVRFKPKRSLTEVDQAIDDIDVAATAVSSANLMPENEMNPQSSEQIIREKIVDTVDALTNTVVSNINRLRVQLDSLEAAMLASSKATKEALAHHITIGAETLKAAQQIERQIESYRVTVQETTPNSPPAAEAPAKE